MQSIFFTKLSTLDNNYLILNYLEQPELSLDYAILAKHMTNPCNGISSEKMIILLPSKIANFKMITYNPDGSRAKTCANGLRVVG
ncbi:MAG: diaminopimelate epimerase, partial [Turicibacter sp.]|nr:diaminopimelate epimerase [Turicibacter sp.]